MAASSRRQPGLLGLLGLGSSAIPKRKAESSSNSFRGGATVNQGASYIDRALAAWRPALRSADADLLHEQGTLVSRARDLDRNSGIAKGGIQTIVDNVVGTGLRLNPRPNYVALGRTKEWADEWARGVRAWWVSWSETTACDAADTMIFDQMSAQVLRAQLISGDACALPLWLPDSLDGWATKIQTIDADRLTTPVGETESTMLRAGIRMNEYGAPIGYWFRSTHPTDYLFSVANPLSWVYVPKYTTFGRRRVIHCYDKERTGQTRGKPILSSVLSNFKGLDRYQQAEIQAAVVNAMVAMVIQTPMDQEAIQALFQNERDAYLQSRRDHAVPIESGAMLPLFPGDTMQSFTPARPASGFGMFVENVSRIIAVGLDMPYELLLKDFTKANYSSMRAAMLEAWRSFNRRRDDIGTQWADPIYALWLEEAISSGKVDAPDFYENRAAYTRCRWIGPGRGWVDPTKEAQAAETRLQTRLSTLEDECAEQGRDWRDVLEQIAVEYAYKKELGIPEIVTVRPGVMAEASPDAEALGRPQQSKESAAA